MWGGHASERGGVGLKGRHLQPAELGLNMIQALETEVAVEEELSSAPATNELGLEEQLTLCTVTMAIAQGLCLKRN